MVPINILASLLYFGQQVDQWYAFASREANAPTGPSAFREFEAILSWLARRSATAKQIAARSNFYTGGLGALEGASVDEIEIAWIVAGAGDWRQIRTGLPKADRADGPSAEECLRDAAQVAQKVSIVTYGQFIDGGDQHTIATDGGNVTSIRGKVKTIGYGRSVDDFGRERRGSIAADIAKALRPDMAGLQG